MTQKLTRAYLYRWTQISTGMWYVGSRSARGCHPGDGYICSSKTVKPMVVENKLDWYHEILVIGEPSDIVILESQYLKILDAKNDPMSFNMHNGDGKWTNASKSMRPCPQHVKDAISRSNSGKASIPKGSIVITDGINERRINETDIIPEGWHRGRIDCIGEKIGKTQRGIAKQSVSDALRGRSLTDDHRKNLVIGKARWKESKTSEEIESHYLSNGKKISDACRGVKKTKTSKLLAAEAARKNRTPVQKLKCGDSNRGRTWKIINGKREWIDKL